MNLFHEPICMVVVAITKAIQPLEFRLLFFQLHHSNATHAFLYRSEMQTEGVYGCEVSTEMPQFRTIKAEKELYVYGE